MMQNADPVTDTQLNAAATGATGHWVLEEDAKLTSSVNNTLKKKFGNEYRRVKREIRVGADGVMLWTPTSTERVDASVNGQQSKTSS
jgi:hypothetical protein